MQWVAIINIWHSIQFPICQFIPIQDLDSGFILNGSSLSPSGRMLLSLSISGTSWSIFIWTRFRVPDISLIFWICSAYLANFRCLSVKALVTEVPSASTCWNQREKLKVIVKILLFYVVSFINYLILKTEISKNRSFVV